MINGLYMMHKRDRLTFNIFAVENEADAILMGLLYGAAVISFRFTHFAHGFVFM